MRTFYKHYWMAHGIGMSWERFFIVPAIILVLFMIFHLVRNSQSMMPGQIAKHAPTHVIEQAVQESVPEGYVLVKTGEYAQDTENRNVIIIERIISTPNYAEQIKYTWTWEVPKSLLKEKDETKILAELENCVLTPVSEDAIELHPRVVELLGSS